LPSVLPSILPSVLPPVRRRALFVFAALVVVLLAPWPRLGRAFGVAFSGYSNALVAIAGFGPPAPRFGLPAPGVVDPADGGDWAVMLTAGDRATPLDTRIIAYTPIAIFLALALVTPGPRRRRLLVLAGGGSVMLARQAFAVLVPLARAFGGGSALTESLWTVLITPPVMSYATPLVVWWSAVALTTPPAPAPAPVDARTPPRTRARRRPARR
jgi:hypothetical protein